MRNLITTVLIALMLIQQAFALGVSPADTRISFTSGMYKEVKLTIVNDGGGACVLGVSVEGELTQYMNISEKELTLKEGDKKAEVVFSIKLPAAMEVGRKESKISIVRDTGEGGISSRIAISHRVILEIPTEFGRVTAKLNATPGHITILLKNPKEQQVKEVGYSIEVKDREKSIGRLSKEGIEIPPLATAKLKLSLSSQKEGEFTADSIIVYNGENYPEHSVILIGKPRPNITADTSQLILGKVNPLRVAISNNWNKGYNARIQTRIMSGANELSSTLSEDFSLPAYGSVARTLYIDAAKLKPGKYSIQIVLSYGDSKAVFNMPVSLEEKKPAEIVKETRFPFFPIFMGLAIIIASAAVFMLLRKKYKD